MPDNAEVSFHAIVDVKYLGPVAEMRWQTKMTPRYRVLHETSVALMIFVVLFLLGTNLSKELF